MDSKEDSCGFENPMYHHDEPREAPPSYDSSMLNPTPAFNNSGTGAYYMDKLGDIDAHNFQPSVYPAPPSYPQQPAYGYPIQYPQPYPYQQQQQSFEYQTAIAVDDFTRAQQEDRRRRASIGVGVGIASIFIVVIVVGLRFGLRVWASKY